MPRLPEWSEYPSSYIDPSTRNFEVVKMISEYIDVPEDTIVSQPWRKPNCIDMESLKYVKFFDDVQTIKVK